MKILFTAIELKEIIKKSKDTINMWKFIGLLSSCLTILSVFMPPIEYRFMMVSLSVVLVTASDYICRQAYTLIKIREEELNAKRTTLPKTKRHD